MEYEVEQFRCPICGQHAPLERLNDGPYPLAKFIKTLGGKSKLTPEERRTRKGRKGVGSAPGRLEYVEVPLDPQLEELVRKRLNEIQI